MLKVKNITVRYEQPVLEEVSFSVSPGERLGLIGSNGAGKSTLLLALIGVASLSAGSITVDSIPVEKKYFREIRRKAGMVFQNPEDQLFMPTVADDVGFGLRNYGFDETAVDERVDAILSRLGISRLKSRMARKLSGGEKRLAALAGTLALEPSLLLLDEPSSFLDPRSRRTLIGVLADLPQAMIIATHDFELALDLCPRTLLLKDGRIFAEGVTETLLRDQLLLAACGL
ncbi:MAG: energy-coupling factor ABC transporter ATP-binding protein [Spirochaetaceae bacterium]|jgi:cobalt/nickel transport system ATP-binding protein|nr:energy-coupling factor ABC transporter ATP-binding protein [Spirochaetaceae bacterium]